jgi:hypothetical protein
MAKKIYPPSEAMQKKIVIKSILKQIDQHKNVIKDALRPTIQWREDLIDEIRSKAIINNPKDYLTIDIDKYGFFIIDGNTLDIIHSKSSNYGQLLKLLYEYRREILDRNFLQKMLETSDLKITIKELRRQLRSIGFEPEIISDRSNHTIMFNGIYYK